MEDRSTAFSSRMFHILGSCGTCRMPKGRGLGGGGWDWTDFLLLRSFTGNGASVICKAVLHDSVSYGHMLLSSYKTPLPSHPLRLISRHILISPGNPMFLTSTPFRNSATPGIFPCLINSALWLMIGSIIMLATATTVSPFP